MKIIVPKVFTSAAIQNTSYSLELDGNIHYKCHAIHHLPVPDVVMPIDEQPHDHWRHEAHGVAQRVDHAYDKLVNEPLRRFKVPRGGLLLLGLLVLLIFAKVR